MTKLRKFKQTEIDKIPKEWEMVGMGVLQICVSGKISCCLVAICKNKIIDMITMEGRQ